MATPNGKWIGKEEPPHKCILPAITFMESDGDRWECECGGQWVVYTESQYGEYWPAFKPIPGGRYER